MKRKNGFICHFTTMLKQKELFESVVNSPQGIEDLASIKLYKAMMLDGFEYCKKKWREYYGEIFHLSKERKPARTKNR